MLSPDTPSVIAQNDAAITYLDPYVLQLADGELAAEREEDAPVHSGRSRLVAIGRNAACFAVVLGVGAIFLAPATAGPTPAPPALPRRQTAMINPIPAAPTPAVGNRAEVTVGAPSRRITATRLAALGPFALLAKKDTTRIYLNVFAADGEQWVHDYPAKEEAAKRRLAARYNNASTPAAVARAAKAEKRAVARRAAKVRYQGERADARAAHKARRSAEPPTPRADSRLLLKVDRKAARLRYKDALRAS